MLHAGVRRWPGGQTSNIMAPGKGGRNVTVMYLVPPFTPCLFIACPPPPPTTEEDWTHTKQMPPATKNSDTAPFGMLLLFRPSGPNKL